MEINSDEVIFTINKLVKEQVNNHISTICDSEGWNYVEIAEKYGLVNNTIRRDYKPKKKRDVKIPLPADRCIAIASEGDQCKRSKKDCTEFCRRHQKKHTYGTIHDKPAIKKSTNKIVQNIKTENEDDELEIEHKGNLITLEDDTEVIFIPTTGFCYSHTMHPEKLGTLSEDNKKIIPI